MDVFYTITNYIGYFLVLILFSILAIIFAKKLFSWIFYLLGAGITLISLMGTQETYDYYGREDYFVPYWIVYFILLIIVAIIMMVRYNSSEDAASKSYDNGNNTNSNRACTCDLCGCFHNNIVRAKITDKNGTAYKNLCENCLQKYSKYIRKKD